MDEEIANTPTEKLTDTLLRSAYVAVVMYKHDNFSRELRRDFEKLEAENWPIFISNEGQRSDKEKELVKKINDWFETHLIRNMFNHIDDPKTLQQIYNVMAKALGIPEANQEIIGKWLQAETVRIAEESISRQVRRIMNNK